MLNVTGSGSGEIMARIVKTIEIEGQPAVALELEGLRRREFTEF